MTKLYVFDLDSTLADIEHRMHFITQPEGWITDFQGHFKPDWKSFFDTCVNDKPIQWAIDLLRLVSRHGTVLILTGRNADVEGQTRDWLCVHNVLYDYLIMRPVDDHAPDDFLKPKLLEKFLRDKDYQVQFIVDDRKRVVEAYRKLGYNVLQCANGDY